MGNEQSAAGSGSGTPKKEPRASVDASSQKDRRPRSQSSSQPSSHLLATPRCVVVDREAIASQHHRLSTPTGEDVERLARRGSRRGSRISLGLPEEHSPPGMGGNTSRRGSRAGQMEGRESARSNGGVVTLMEAVKLSSYQCSLLISTWAKLRRDQHVFSQVFKDLCCKSAVSREIFQKMSILEGFKSGQSSCDLNAHFRYLTELFDTLLADVSQPAKTVQSRCIDIGTRHCAMSEKTVGGVWEQLGETLAEVFTRQEIVRQKREAVKAWIQLISYLVDLMKSGYISECRRRQNRPSFGHADAPEAPVVVAAADRDASVHAASRSKNVDRDASTHASRSMMAASPVASRSPVGQPINYNNNNNNSQQQQQQQQATTVLQ